MPNARQTNTHEPPLAAPAGPKIVGELAGLLQIPRLALRGPRLAFLPRGDQTVVCFPGFGTGDVFTAPLRGALRSLGHKPYGWGFGINRGDVEGMIDTVQTMVERQADRAGRPVALIGWSLGGIFAREVARENPEVVTRVITYGTPVIGGPRYTRGAAAYGEEQVTHIESVVEERNQIPIRRPVTAIHTRTDGIVDWRACIDTFSPDVENIEVSSTHAGMGIDPDVWSLIARRLAETTADT